MCCCINGIGNALPPVFVFPRVHFRDYVLHGAPPGSVGFAVSSGWMNSDLFPKALQHFIEQMNVSPNNPAILFLDNHCSHLSIEAIALAKQNGLHLLTFPPHCSHRLQPLDVCVYGPFKRFYASLSDSWLTNNPGRAISIHDVAFIAGQAFQKSFTRENIVSAFKSTGICPFNPDVFGDDAFLPAAVTNLTVIRDDEEQPPQASNAPSMSTQASPRPAFTDILMSISPHPQVSADAQRSKRRKTKSAIITDTPNKEKIAPSEPVRNKTKRRRVVFDSSSEDGEDALVLQSDSTSCYDTDEDSVECRPNDTPAPVTVVQLEDFVVAKVFSQGKNWKNFVAQVVAGPDKDGDFDVKFMKRSCNIKYGFIFPEVEDWASIKLQDIVKVLPKPLPIAATKRLSGIYKFQINLDLLGV